MQLPFKTPWSVALLNETSMFPDEENCAKVMNGGDGAE